MPTIVLNSPDIHCEVCAERVTKAASAVAGVLNVRVEIPEQCVTVEYDSPATEGDVRSALEDAGFEVSPSQS
ncbi:MAG: hypothetical protein C4341_03035 [Armatimonadota bacterium]